MRASVLSICIGLSLIAPAAASAIPQDAGKAKPKASADEFPEAWFWRMGQAGPKHRQMTGKAAPALTVKGWVGKDDEIAPLKAGDPIAALKGKVIVVDFWATWCGPCRAALPENVAMMRDLKGKGLVVIGVHDASKGSETMQQVASSVGVEYPLAIDDGGKSAKAWSVGFWPTYAVIDRKGTLRAIGLQPQNVRKVVEKLLAEDAPSLAKPDEKTPDKKEAPGAKPAEAPAAKPISASLLEGDAQRRTALARFDNCPKAPDLELVGGWLNTDAGMGKALSELKGKVVVLDFWATWCGPCIQSIPHNNELAKKYADKGLVMIGVCSPRGGEQMPDTVKSKGIAYPVCVDAKGRVNASYSVDGYPDYYIIDRQGRVRGADVNSTALENAIVQLLAEK
jgi:cytochrome c biogenesis protein CcmG, thiol:disulfide interchange protein DsbE